MIFLNRFIQWKEKNPRECLVGSHLLLMARDRNVCLFQWLVQKRCPFFICLTLFGDLSIVGNTVTLLITFCSSQSLEHLNRVLMNAFRGFTGPITAERKFRNLFGGLCRKGPLLSGSYRFPKHWSLERVSDKFCNKDFLFIV